MQRMEVGPCTSQKCARENYAPDGHVSVTGHKSTISPNRQPLQIEARDWLPVALVLAWVRVQTHDDGIHAVLKREMVRRVPVLLVLFHAPHVLLAHTDKTLTRMGAVIVQQTAKASGEEGVHLRRVNALKGKVGR